MLKSRRRNQRGQAQKMHQQNAWLTYDSRRIVSELNVHSLLLKMRRFPRIVPNQFLTATLTKLQAKNADNYLCLLTITQKTCIN